MVALETICSLGYFPLTSIQKPELTVIKRKLHPVLLNNSTIQGVSIFNINKTNQEQIEIKSNLINSKILEINHYGKFLYIITDNTRYGCFYVDLGISGSIRIKEINSILDIDNKSDILINIKSKQNQFTIQIISSQDFGITYNLKELIYIKNIGPDILLTDKRILSIYLKTIRKKTDLRQRIYSFLSNQKIISGIDDYVIFELLHNCKIHPYKTIDLITIEELDSLFSELKELFNKWNIYSSKFNNIDSEQLSVFYKEGSNCKRCNEKIRAHVFKLSSKEVRKDNRILKCYYCPKCQGEY